MTKEELLKYDGKEIIYNGIQGILGFYMNSPYIFWDNPNIKHSLKDDYPSIYEKYKKRNAHRLYQTDIKNITLKNFINLNDDWWWSV
jgi:hypothetical protein